MQGHWRRGRALAIGHPYNANPAMALYKPLLVILVMLVSVFPLTMTHVSASGDPLDISMPGEAAQKEGGVPVIISGFWHDVSFSAGTKYDDLTLELFSGTAVPAVTNYTNYYLFNCTKGVFKDDLYDKWLDPSGSSNDVQEYSFRLAVFAGAKLGEWTLRMTGDGAVIREEKVKVIESLVRISLSAPNIVFELEPHSPGPYMPSGADYIRTINQGNVPLELSIEYDHLGDWMTQTNITVSRPGGDKRHYLTLEAPSWEAGETTIEGTITGTPLHRGPGDIVTLSPTYALSFNVEILVGRGGLELADYGAFVMQYPKELAGEKKKDMSWDFYLNGIKEITLDIKGERADIVTVLMDGTDTQMPITLNLTDGRERHFNITVRPIVAGTNAVVTYTVRTTDGAVQKEFYTGIDVPPISTLPDDGDPEQDRTGAIIFVLGALAAMVLFGLVIYRKSCRTRELEQWKEKKAREGKKMMRKKKGGRRR